MSVGGRTGGTRPIDQPCPACAHPELVVFFEEHGVPRNSCLLMESPDEATGFPTGDLVIAWCEACGFVTNTAFAEGSAEYSQRYEETQAFSGRFVAFARELAERWVRDHDLAGKTVLEVGCGKGEFLVLMAEAGIGKGIGIDPGVHPERIDSTAADRLEWIADFYDERYSDLEVDAVVCRHTLEHIPDVAAFMTNIRRSIGDRTRPDGSGIPVLFELPDVHRVLDEVAFWDIYHEHCSYFSAGSLARLFRRTGFEVTGLSREYDDQYLVIESRTSTTPAPGEPFPAEDDLESLARSVDNFVEAYDKIATGWRQRLDEVAARGERSVIWGGGSKGVSFVSNLGLDHQLHAAVDINPHKWGRYLVGSPHPVVAPAALVDIDPALVVVMNPVYIEEITAELDQLGLHPEVVAL